MSAATAAPRWTARRRRPARPAGPGTAVVRRTASRVHPVHGGSWSPTGRWTSNSTRGGPLATPTASNAAARRSTGRARPAAPTSAPQSCPAAAPTSSAYGSAQVHRARTSQPCWTSSLPSSTGASLAHRPCATSSDCGAGPGRSTPRRVTTTRSATSSRPDQRLCCKPLGCRRAAGRRWTPGRAPFLVLVPGRRVSCALRRARQGAVQRYGWTMSRTRTCMAAVSSARAPHRRSPE